MPSMIDARRRGNGDGRIDDARTGPPAYDALREIPVQIAGAEVIVGSLPEITR
jgi:hypothetical protein